MSEPSVLSARYEVSGGLPLLIVATSLGVSSLWNGE